VDLDGEDEEEARKSNSDSEWEMVQSGPSEAGKAPHNWLGKPI